jgi:hypothetical protein
MCSKLFKPFNSSGIKHKVMESLGKEAIDAEKVEAASEAEKT